MTEEENKGLERLIELVQSVDARAARADEKANMNRVVVFALAAAFAGGFLWLLDSGKDVLDSVTEATREISAEIQVSSEQNAETAKVLAATAANVQALSVRLQDTRDELHKDEARQDEAIRELRRGRQWNGSSRQTPGGE